MVRRIVHLTSAHPANDVRIFHKEGRSLQRAGYDVAIVAPHDRDEVVDGVRILGVPRGAGRLRRFTSVGWNVYRRARAERAHLYHFHDPDLMMVAALLRHNGARVVYDVHEDFPTALVSGGRDYLPRPARVVVGHVVDRLERHFARTYSAVVAATPAIRGRFERFGVAAVEVNNYPHPGELQQSARVAWSCRERRACYVGAIDWARGLREMVEAMARLPAYLGARLSLVGAFSSDDQRQQAQTLDGWEAVDATGPRPRSDLPALLSSVRAGLVIFHPDPNHVRSQPNKLFEYMSAGLPVVASDFPAWRALVERERCGLVAAPSDVGAIASAIERLLTDDEEAEQMGANGLRAVERQYNWASQERTLLDLYERLLA